MGKVEKYKVVATPSLQTVTPGAVVTYYCSEAHGAYRAPGAPDDSCQWHCYNDPEMAKRAGAPLNVTGPDKFIWKDAKWSFCGRHMLTARVRYHDTGVVQYFSYPQWVEEMDVMIARALYAYSKKRAPDPTLVLNRLERYINVVKQIAKASPPTNDDSKERYRHWLEEHEKYRDKLRERLKSTNRCRRIPIFAVHREKVSQKETTLQVFVAQIKDSGNSQTWALIDWTNPVVRETTGEYIRSAPTAREAIFECLDAWDSGNRYPDGKLAYHLPLHILKEGVNGSFETDGASFWDSVAKFFDTVATGAAIVMAVVTLVAPVPGARVISAAIWTSVFSSTAAAVLNIGQRHDEGFGWGKDDLLDGVTIVSNLFTVGTAWARGAKILAKDTKDKLVGRLLVAQITTDSVQGVLMAAEKYNEIQAILDDKSLSPDERATKLLKVLASAAGSGALSYISLRGTHKDLQKHRQETQHLPHAEAPTPAEKLKALADPEKTIDLTKPVPMEGHTAERRQRTTHQTQPVRRHAEPVRARTHFEPPPSPPARGMKPRDDKIFSRLARRKKLIILVRDSNSEATKFIGKEGHAAKPMELKAKTIRNEPGQPPNPSAGLAAANPADARLKRMLEAWDMPDGSTKAITYDDYLKYLGDHGYKVGGPPDHLVMDKIKGTKYYSDYDLHGVYREGSSQSAYSEDFRRTLNQNMGGERIRHPGHDQWPKRESRSAADNRGPQPPVTAYLPDGTSVHLNNIADMKKFYADHGINFDSIYKNTKYNPNYPAAPHPDLD